MNEKLPTTKRSLTLNEVIGWHRAAMAHKEHWRAVQTWAWVMAQDPAQGTMLALDMTRQGIRHEILDWIAEHPEEAVKTSGLCTMYGELGVGKGYGRLNDYLFRHPIPKREDIEIEQAFDELEVVCTGSVAWHELKALTSKWSKTDDGFSRGAVATLRWATLAPYQRSKIVEKGLEAWLESRSLKVRG